MNKFFAPLELKFAQEDTPTGGLEGYGSVFGNIDSYGDTIAPGAFKHSLAEYAAQGRKISMYIQHAFGDPRPIGVWDSVEEDAKGLYVKGRILGLDTETGRYHYALAKGGALQGLSIGFKTLKSDYPNEPGKPKRVIKEVKLFEVSLVDQPANPAALIGQIKSLDEAKVSLRELEEYLRERYGMPKSEATGLIACVKRICSGEPAEANEGAPSGEPPSNLEDLAELLRRNVSLLKP
jgi:HK97 family phage prohead protease